MGLALGFGSDQGPTNAGAHPEWNHRVDRIKVGRLNERNAVPTEPYEFQFVDTPGGRAANTSTHSNCTLATAPERLIQLGMFFGSSQPRLRQAERRRLRGLGVRCGSDRRNPCYVAAHVCVGDGRFQESARRNMRTVWW
ncbi:hypothetical protein JVU11DRAFT_12715 [Chiua virens]|nr:hypothetical protein JVU11DRAFT_12715 [Chiua virens]